MKIAGFHKNSLVDYGGKVAAVVFTPGCNFNCFYCHNRSLLSAPDDACLYDCEQIIRFLEKRKGLLDGFVISGGEPTLQKGLMAFIADVKSLGFPVKLDTNGSSPEVIETVVEKGLADYIAMDLKAPFERYDEICGVRVDIGAIRQSINLLMRGSVEYEFRTTVVPQLGHEDILVMAKVIEGARLYALQQYRPVPDAGGSRVIDLRVKRTPHKPLVLEEMAGLASNHVKKCIIRGSGGVRHGNA